MSRTFSPSTGLPSNWPLASMVAIMLLAFALRLHNLGGDSFWIDEILTIYATRGGPEAYLSQLSHPPLLYALNSIVIGTFGESEFAARIVSFVAAVLSIPLIFTLGRLLDRRATGLWAAFMLALSPFHVTYAQEARHYSLLMMLTMSSFVALYLALKRDKWSSWLLYALLVVLSIYTHYAALLVLLAQGTLVAVWLVLRRRGAVLAAGKKAAFASIVVALLYLPWLPHLGRALNHNVGGQVVTGTGGVTPIDQWVRQGFGAFGMSDTRIAFLLLILALIGVITLAIRRRWLSLLFVIAGIAIPLLLIGIVPVGRGSFPRYIIYVLPPYLLSAAIGLEWLLRRLHSQPFRLAGAAAMAILLLVVGWGAIRGVHKYVQEDWRSILAYLDEEASSQAVLLALSQNARAGFNLVAASLPYYLDRSDSQYQLLQSNRLSLDKASALAGKDSDVWGIVFDWQEPTSLQSDNLSVTPFQSALYVVHDPQQTGSSLDKSIGLYEQLIPLVQEPEQACRMREDLVSLQAVNGAFEDAGNELLTIGELCGSARRNSGLKRLGEVVLKGLQQGSVASGSVDTGRRLARQILEIDSKEPTALGVLTAMDLAQAFADGNVELAQADSPEPVRMERFVMPHNGDWGDAILVHPPAALSYHLDLPGEPVTFWARLAMAPSSWDWGGDGATFVLKLKTEEEETVELYRQHVDNSAEDHDWHDVSVSLGQYAGERVVLTLTTEAGPAGDATGDWAGWERPRLIWPSPQRTR